MWRRAAIPCIFKGTHLRAYQRLTEGDRGQVYASHKTSLGLNSISEQVSLNKPTAYRELRRDKGVRAYRSKQALRLACSRKAKIPRTRSLDEMCAGIKKWPAKTKLVAVTFRPLNSFIRPFARIPMGYYRLRIKGVVANYRARWYTRSITPSARAILKTNINDLEEACQNQISYLWYRPASAPTNK